MPKDAKVGVAKRDSALPRRRLIKLGGRGGKVVFRKMFRENSGSLKIPLRKKGGSVFKQKFDHSHPRSVTICALQSGLGFRNQKGGGRKKKKRVTLCKVWKNAVPKA